MLPRAVFLDAATIGHDIDLAILHEVCDLQVHNQTADEEFAERCRGAEIIITNKVRFSRQRLQQLSPQLRLICLTATGYNNVDTTSAAELGITVSNVRGYSTDSVAQHTLATTLALLQQIDYYHRYTADGRYSNADVFTHFGRPWYELAGKTWGIIGLGAIGSRVAEIAAAIGCRVVYYSSSGVDRDPRYQRLSLPELLQTSQVVSIHAPLNEQTRGLIGTRELQHMRPESLLVNVGRGGIVEEGALAHALRNNRLRGAALDVFVHEPIETESSLLQVSQDRLLLTPHVAWGSTEARTRVIEGVRDNIRGYLDGTPRNSVS